MRPRGCARRSSAARRAHGSTASSDLGLLASQLEVEVFERPPPHFDALELEALVQRLPRQLVECARRLVGRDHELLAVSAVTDLDPGGAREELAPRTRSEADSDADGV